MERLRRSSARASRPVFDSKQQGTDMKQERILPCIHILDIPRQVDVDGRLQTRGQERVPRRREIGAPIDALHLRQCRGFRLGSPLIIKDARFAAAEGEKPHRLGRFEFDVKNFVSHFRPPF
jgi:hypothetical protein